MGDWKVAPPGLPPIGRFARRGIGPAAVFAQTVQVAWGSLGRAGPHPRFGLCDAAVFPKLSEKFPNRTLSIFGRLMEHLLCMTHEAAVIERAAAAFIHDRFRLGAFVNGLLRDAHASEDVMQEVWVRLAAELKKGTVIENQPAWCRGVARNLILKHWRQRQTAKVVADSELMEIFLEQVEQAFRESDHSTDEWERRQQALEDCVATLPERARRMLSLRYEGRVSMEEIARTTGQSFDAVTKALYRLRQSLADCVERKLSNA